MEPMILIFGHNEHLLRSRCWVLQSQGFEARTTTDVMEAGRLLITQEIELLILCHTLPMEERESLLAIASSLHPPVKVLILDSDEVLRGHAEGAHVLYEFPGPRVLIEAVQALTGRDGGVLASI
jgi:hypothetical protein